MSIATGLAVFATQYSLQRRHYPHWSDPLTMQSAGPLRDDGERQLFGDPCDGFGPYPEGWTTADERLFHARTDGAARGPWLDGINYLHPRQVPTASDLVHGTGCEPVDEGGADRG